MASPPTETSWQLPLANGYGRFYPSQRDTAYATVLLLTDAPFPDDGPLRLGFWLPLAGFHLLALHDNGANATAVDETLAILNGRALPDGISVDPDRIVLAGWGAGGSLALHYAATHPTLHHVVVIAGRGSQPAAIPSLATRNLLLIGGWQDEQAPLEEYLLPLYRTLRNNDNTTVEIVGLDADHHFTDSHFTLAKTIWEWLRQVLPTADAPRRDAAVSLREITAETARAIMSLKVTPEQRQFVASNEISMAQAYFQRQHAWFRAIYADETPVGFLMLYDNPEEREYFLWRFMIDTRYQGMGYGRRALDLLVDHVKTRPGADKLLVSCVPGSGSPCPFYEQLGFTYTGEKEGIELVMALRW